MASCGFPAQTLRASDQPRHPTVHWAPNRPGYQEREGTLSSTRWSRNFSRPPRSPPEHRTGEGNRTKCGVAQSLRSRSLAADSGVCGRPGPLLWAVGSGAGAQADEAQVAMRVPVGSVWPRPGELQVRRTLRRAPPSPDPPWTLGPRRGGRSAVLGTRRARPVPGPAETDSHHPVWWFPSFSGDVPRGNLKTE